MAKQKFYCKGVERASGRRVAVTLSADNKEAAVRIAIEHGVLVESVVPAGEQELRPAAGHPPIAERVVEGTDEDVSGLLDSPDDEAEGLDLAAAAKPASPTAPATKSCPYCGERVLAVAIRCKHCGSYLAEEQPAVRRPVADAAPRATMPPRAWVAIAAVAGVILIAAAVWKVFFDSSAPPAPPLPVATPVQPAPTPPVPAPPPKPEPPKPSAEEKAYAVKLAAFLDGCDATMRLLETAPKPDEYHKQCETLKALYTAIPSPPKTAPWAAEAALTSKQVLDATEMISNMGAINDLLPAEARTTNEVYRQTAEKMRGLVAMIRGQIPPACLTP